MGATLTTAQSILKEIYEGRIQDQLNEEYNALKRITRSSDGIVDTVGGKYVTFPVRVTRNPGISYRSEESQLAPPGNQGYAATQIRLKYGYGRVRLSGPAMDLADVNFQAFASVLDEEMNRLKDDLAKDSNRIAYGDPTNNGVIAMINDTTTSATHAVVNAQWLQVGEVVDVLVATTGAATGGGTALTINAVDYVNNTVTFSGSIGATTTTLGIYRTGDRTQEPDGIRTAVNNTGQYENIDPATQPLWKAEVDSPGSNRPLAESLMITMCDRVRRNGGKITVIFMPLGVRRAYFNLLTQQRRYTDTKSFAGGFQGLPFNYGTEIPVVEDVDAPVSQVWFLDESKWKVYQRKDWAWAEEDNTILKWVQDYDSWQALMRKYWNLGLSQRNANALLDKVTEA